MLTWIHCLAFWRILVQLVVNSANSDTLWAKYASYYFLFSGCFLVPRSCNTFNLKIATWSKCGRLLLNTWQMIPIRASSNWWLMINTWTIHTPVKNSHIWRFPSNYIKCFRSPFYLLALIMKERYVNLNDLFWRSYYLLLTSLFLYFIKNSLVWGGGSNWSLGLL